MPENNSDVETVHVVNEPAPEPPKETPKVEGEGSGEGDGLIGKMLETPAEGSPEGLKKAVGKIRLKLDKFGLIISESEQWVFSKYKLNDLMKPEEIDAEKTEIKEDVGLILETRIKIISKFGDIINLVIDIMSHVAVRAVRFASKKGVIKSGETQEESGIEQRAAAMGIPVDQYKALGGV